MEQAKGFLIEVRSQHWTPGFLSVDGLDCYGWILLVFATKFTTGRNAVLLPLHWEKPQSVGRCFPRRAFWSERLLLHRRSRPKYHVLCRSNDVVQKIHIRNLKRGVDNGLPSGQEISSAMGLPAVTPAESAPGPDGEAAEAHGVYESPPLWYYILKETEVKGEGKRLGPTGSRIPAEVFLGLVHGDRSSFLWQWTNWKPELLGATAGDFTMADLINFVDDINPIGD